MRNRSGASIDAEAATHEELDAEIARILTTSRLTPRRSNDKSLFSTLAALEAVRELRFGVAAPVRKKRARQN